MTEMIGMEDMKKRYMVEYVTIKDNLWAVPHEIFVDAENMNQIISEIDKVASGKWYITRLWERREVGKYDLINN